MARSKPLDKDAQKIADENEAALRMERHTLAQNAAPAGHAGRELLEGSEERKAKQAEAKKGSEE
jgi:hypothetical protein